MLDWNEILFRSLYYIGIASPVVFFACCAIICLIDYLNHKQEKKRKMLKKYNKQRKSKHTRLTDINSDSNTQLCQIDVENPYEDSDRLDETYPLLNIRDSINGSFINDPNKRHLKYSDSTLLLPEEDTFEDMSENETDLHEKLSCLQNKRNKSQKELISLKISESRLAYLAWKDIQSKCRPHIMCCENSIGKQCKCNRADPKSYTTQKNTIKENPLVGNRNFADTSLTIDPVEVIHKKSDCKYDKEIGISSLKHASNNNKGLETNISTQKFPQYHFENDQEYMVNSANILPLLKTHEKCKKSTVSKEENFTSKIQETECFPHDRNNPQEISSYHKDLRAPLFQNSNIPIAKRVLEDEQFYDLRQKFCGAENIQNASKPMTDEQRFNRGITNNKEIYQPDAKSYTLRGEKYFEEENIKYPRMRYAAHFTEEIENENQTSNVSSTCDTSDKEEAMCSYWKSLKTKKTVSQKRNKGVQVEISSVRSNDTEQVTTEGKKDFSKGKSQEAIQSKQDIPKQAQGTIVKKNAQNNMRNQSTQINRNQKLHIPIESPQIEIIEHYPKAQLYSAQMPDDKRHAENRTCRNCKSFLASGDYSEERIDATKPRTIYSRTRLIQTEPHYPCDEHLLPNYEYIYNVIQNEDGLIQLLPHKIKNNRQNMHDIAKTDVKGIQTSEVILIPPNHGKEYSKQTSKDIPKKSKSQIKIDAEQAIEKSNAEQIQAKENVLKQIKRMYSHMDPNIHEMNKSVVTQVKKVLKSKEMWHPELLQSKRK